ncbi:radical SAM protein [Patescibacteria group bacterium]|nr:radical SAM protein [Patescibacteria group bacterium]
MNKCTLPIDCVLAVTYRCNSRCNMCDIWKLKDFPEMSFGEFAKLPASLRDINLSGGEPFLRMDLSDIAREVKKACPRARIVISSNGFATELIVAQMKKILPIMPGIGVAISIDGVGEMHDELRGIKGGFEMAMNTVWELKKMGLKNLRLAFTLMAKNVSHLSKVYDLSRELGVEFTHSFAQSSEFYFGGKQNVDNNPRRDLLDKEYAYLIKSELRSWNLKRWARAYFAHGMFEFVTGNKQVLSNAPGRDFFFLDPSGNIYPSVVHNAVMGNLKSVVINNHHARKSAKRSLGLARDDSEVDTSLPKNDKCFKVFWCSDEMVKKRKQVDAMKIPVWMICTARTAIKKHPWRVAWWVLRNKFF